MFHSHIVSLNYA